MKHAHSKPLISFRKLHGGQFGTLDVTSLGPHSVQFALGSDYVFLTRAQWLAMRVVVDRALDCESETVVATDGRGDTVVVERDGDGDEVEVDVIPVPPPAARNRGTRRRSAAG